MPILNCCSNLNYLAGSVQETLPVEKIAHLVEKFGCESPQVTKYSFGAACRILASKREL